MYAGAHRMCRDLGKTAWRTTDLIDPRAATAQEKQHGNLVGHDARTAARKSELKAETREVED